MVDRHRDHRGRQPRGGQHLQGWITNQHLLRAIAPRIATAAPDIEAGHLSAEWATPHPDGTDHDPRTQLEGYQVVEFTVADDSAGAGRKVADVGWPPAHLPVALIRNRQLDDIKPGTTLKPGDRIDVLVPHPTGDAPDEVTEELQGRG